MVDIASDTVSDLAEADDAVLLQFVGYHLRRTSNLVQSDLTRVLRELDLRMITMSVLTVITENPGVRQSHLADVLSIERPNLVAVLDELEQRDLVERARVPTDRRAYALTATVKGRNLSRRAVKAMAEHEARLFAGLSSSDRKTLLDALATVRSNAEA